MILTKLLITLQLLNIINASWIDPDTDESDYEMEALTFGDDRKFHLVYSDEFNVSDRAFGDGKDPRWTALDKNDYTNAALQYYSSDNAITRDGKLIISTERKTKSFIALNETTTKNYLEKKHYKSAMLQGWNKFCFTGGIVEVRAKLPGQPNIGGLWPAIWLLGNLARATYVGSSDYMWPWSFNECNIDDRMSQEINACARVNHFGMPGGIGRGAPEIDILEAMAGESGPLPNTHIERPYFSASLQVSPGIREDRPYLGQQPGNQTWYSGMEYGPITNSSLNPFFYGVTLYHKPSSYTYQSDALSANMHIEETHFEDMHTYRVEWEPSDIASNEGGYIRWYADGELVYGLNHEVLLSGGLGSMIPNEPMYILLNTALSSEWGFPLPCPSGCSCDCFDCNDPKCACAFPAGFCDNFPAEFEIDYVRVWQTDEPLEEENSDIRLNPHEDNNETSRAKGRQNLGCHTPDRPTHLFIQAHKERYNADKSKTKQPLAPIANGGGSCKNDGECGIGGTCNLDSFVCICGGSNYTGPHCRAHNAFYDNPWPLPLERNFRFTTLNFPIGLMIGLVVISVVLFAAVRGKVQRKRVLNGYETIQTEDQYQNGQQEAYLNNAGVLPFPNQ